MSNWPWGQWSPGVRSAARSALLCVVITCGLVVVINLIAMHVNGGNSDRVGSDTPNAPKYKFDDHLRLALVMTSLVLVIFAGASFTTANRTQSRLTATLLGFTDDSELLDSSKILAAHCVAVSLSVMVLSFAGLVSKPLLRNPIAPYIIVSLDLATLPLLIAYTHVVLHELVKAHEAAIARAAMQLARDDRPRKPAPSVLLWGPAVTPWVVAGSAMSLVSCTIVSRLLGNRSAAAGVLAAGWALSIPASAQFSMFLRRLRRRALFPGVRVVSLSISATMVTVVVAACVFEGIYQFADPAWVALTNSAFIADLIQCLALVPLVGVGVVANIVIDQFARNEVAMSLKRMADSRQQLLRWLAHEARVPLNSLAMGLKLVNDARSDVRRAFPDNHDEIVTLSQCGASAEALIAVLSDVLDLDKIDANGLQIRIERTTVGSLLRDVASQMHMMGEAHGVSITVEPLPPSLLAAGANPLVGVSPSAVDGPDVLLDRVHLSQVLMNFLSNAVKFSRPGGRVFASVQLLSTCQVSCREDERRSSRQASTNHGVVDVGRGWLGCLRAILRLGRSAAVDVAPGRYRSKSTEGVDASDALPTAEGGPILRSSSTSSKRFAVRRTIGSTNPARFAAVASAVLSKMRGEDGTALGDTTCQTMYATATDGSRPSFFVDAASGLATALVVEVCVSDEGCGVSLEDSRRLFQAFEQVDAGLQASQFKGRSTGLGLAISRRVVLAHCGEIGIRSSPGAGSEFFARVPVLLASPPTDVARKITLGLGPDELARIRVPRTPAGYEEVGPLLGSPLIMDGESPHRQRSEARSQYQALEKSVATQGSPEVGSPGTALRPLTPGGAANRGARAPPATSRLPPLRRMPLEAAAPEQPEQTVAAAPLRRRPLRALVVDDSAVNKRMLVRLLQRELQAAGVELFVTDAADGKLGLAAAASPSALLPAAAPFDVYLCDAEMPVMNGYDMVAAMRARGDATPAIGITGNALPEDVARFLDAGVQSVVTKPVDLGELMGALRAQLPWLGVE